jgi:hypothetical protein
MGKQAAGTMRPDSVGTEVDDEDLEEESLVVVGEPRPDPKTGKVPGRAVLVRVAEKLAARIAAAHGVMPSLVLLLRVHSVRKTSSGKIARLWNAKAVRQLAAGSADCPWSSSTIVASFAPADRGKPRLAAAASEPGSSAQAGGPVLAAVASSPGAEGEDLLNALRAELAACAGLSDPAIIPTDTAISALGLASLTVAQWVGECRHSYGLVGITDDAVWEAGFTLDWIVASAPALRAGERLMPDRHEGEEGSPKAAAKAEDPAKAATDRHAAPQPLPGIKQPTWFEKNYPCCGCCF